MIRLENFEAGDFKQLIEWIDTDELLTNWAGSLFSFPLSEESLNWYIEDTNDLAVSDAFVYKAVDEKTGESIGHISLGALSRKNRSGRISRVLVGNTAARGRGICQKMIMAILEIGFDQLKLHRISLGVYDYNKSAIKCYEKAGFKIEGTSREVLWYKNSFWSLIEMSILENEWRGLNASHNHPHHTTGH